MSLTRRTVGLKRTSLARGRKRIRPVNRKRQAANYARNFGEEAALVRSLPCLVCGGLSDPAHVTSRGAGGGRFDLVPLCRKHHDEQHSAGVETFAKTHGLDLRAEADRIALLHEPPLGVRGLARYWANEQGKIPCGFTGQTVYERAGLLGWVRRRMETLHAGLVAARRRTAPCVGALGIAATQDPISREVAFALGLAAQPFESQRDKPAWVLCEQAGWPS